MTLFVIILVIAAFLWLMLFKTKKEKTQSLVEKPTDTSIAKIPSEPPTTIQPPVQDAQQPQPPQEPNL